MTKKNIWGSEFEAHRAAFEASEEHGDKHKVYAYECRWCNGWHYSRSRQSNVLVFFGETRLPSGNDLRIFFSHKIVHGGIRRKGNVGMNRITHVAGDSFEKTGECIRRLIEKMLESSVMPNEDTKAALDWYWRVIDGAKKTKTRKRKRIYVD